MGLCGATTVDEIERSMVARLGGRCGEDGARGGQRRVGVDAGTGRRGDRRRRRGRPTAVPRQGRARPDLQRRGVRAARRASGCTLDVRVRPRLGRHGLDGAQQHRGVPALDVPAAGARRRLARGHLDDGARDPVAVPVLFAPTSVHKLVAPGRRGRDGPRGARASTPCRCSRPARARRSRRSPTIGPQALVPAVLVHRSRADALPRRAGRGGRATRRSC